LAPRLWGIIPAAGVGSRIQPLAFSKELLPVGSRLEGGIERPRAVSEYLIERMLCAGVSNLCFVVSPGKTDILEYFGGSIGSAHVSYTVQPTPAGFCDAIFRALPLLHAEDGVIVGLPDTIWFPENGLCFLPVETLAFLLFPVARPELFDSVVLDKSGQVLRIDVKQESAESRWIWGAFRMPQPVFAHMHQLWSSPERRDEYFGTLVNAYIQAGGNATGIKAGQAYVDTGTLHGYREAVQLLYSNSLQKAQSARIP
jgi:glucose-1-phosphate thymidylyltransferase